MERTLRTHAARRTLSVSLVVRAIVRSSTSLPSRSRATETDRADHPSSSLVAGQDSGSVPTARLESDLDRGT